MKIKIGVIYGGESVEHEVSIITAVQAMNKMNQDKYEIVPIYITKEREWYTGGMLRDIEVYEDLSLIKKYATNVVLYSKKGGFVLQKKGLFRQIVNNIDIAFPIVHGTNVEDGTLQGYLQTIGIPYVGSDVYASVVGQDKVYMKNIFAANDLPMPKFMWLYDVDYKRDTEGILDRAKKLKYPLIVKPATTGSSVGIGFVNNEDELKKAIEEAMEYDNKIIIEEVVKNLKELNISVLGNYETQKISAIEEVFSSSKFLTYAEKYIGKGKIKGSKGLKGFKMPMKASKGMLSASRQVPADLPSKLEKEIETMAITAFKALGTSGTCRIDFLYDEKKEKLYINEMNSIPGSLAFYLWESKNIDYTDLLDEMITVGVKDFRIRNSKTRTFETNILKGFTTNGIKGSKGSKTKLR